MRSCTFPRAVKLKESSSSSTLGRDIHTWICGHGSKRWPTEIARLGSSGVIVCEPHLNTSKKRRRPSSTTQKNEGSSPSPSHHVLSPLPFPSLPSPLLPSPLPPPSRVSATFRPNVSIRQVHGNVDQSLLGDMDWITKGAETPTKNQSQCGSFWAFLTRTPLKLPHLSPLTTCRL